MSRFGAQDAELTRPMSRTNRRGTKKRSRGVGRRDLACTDLAGAGQIGCTSRHLQSPGLQGDDRWQGRRHHPRELSMNRSSGGAGTRPTYSMDPVWPPQRSPVRLWDSDRSVPPAVFMDGWFMGVWTGRFPQRESRTPALQQQQGKPHSAPPADLLELLRVAGGQTVRDGHDPANHPAGPGRGPRYHGKPALLR